MKYKDRNYLRVLGEVPEVKEKAKMYGLIAEYVPVAGYIEIMDKNRNVVGITFNGKVIKEPINKQYYNLDKWLKLFGTSLQFLASLGFTDEKPQEIASNADH